MNANEIMQMEAGREMDALVATEVMGWTYDDDWKQIVPPEQAKPPMWTKWMINDETGEMYRKPINEKHLNGISYSGIEHNIILIPEYSTDIAAAWQVVEKMSAKYYVSVWTNSSINTRGFCCSVERYGSLGSRELEYADTAPLAICRAALLATLEAT